jgi:hypothetical protein
VPIIGENYLFKNNGVEDYFKILKSHCDLEALTLKK